MCFPSQPPPRRRLKGHTPATPKAFQLHSDDLVLLWSVPPILQLTGLLLTASNTLAVLYGLSAFTQRTNQSRASRLIG
jgi:hypothetical protein